MGLSPFYLRKYIYFLKCRALALHFRSYTFPESRALALLSGFILHEGEGL
jgi:hypothetical protein